jgi:hypothetical protein
MLAALYQCVSVSWNENVSVVLLNIRGALWNMATIAAAQGCSTNGGKFSPFRRAIAKMPQQRQPLLLSPRVRHYGGCSPASRRFLWRKIRNSAPSSPVPAIHFGDNFAHSAIDRQLSQPTIFSVVSPYRRCHFLSDQH